MNQFQFAAQTLIVAATGFIGCSPEKNGTSNGATSQTPNPNVTDEVAVERAKLNPADRALVEAQEWCVVSTDERLGAMGAPIKLDIKGQPVFVCCNGCRRKAEANPDKTLAKVEELKAKAKADKAAQK